MIDDLERRRGLTFAQAEQVEPLPRQLDRAEVSPRLRSVMWRTIYDMAHASYDGNVTNIWYALLRAYHAEHLCLPVDDFSSIVTLENIKISMLKGDYISFYGVIQFFISRRTFDNGMMRSVSTILDNELSAFRVVERTLIPITSDEEAQAIRAALMETAQANQAGAHSHLAAAVKALSAGAFAESVKESIAAVEAAARTLTGSPAKLSEALAVLEKRGVIHGSLKKALLALYGYTSDEPGLRHCLLEHGEANVDEADALLMLGSCSSFVSYLLAKRAKQNNL